MTRIFITGPTGCIGTATITALLNMGADEIIGFSRSAKPSNPASVAHHNGKVRFLLGDVADPASIGAALANAQPTHIINLAAFQTPDCQKHPFRGMDINAGGPMHLYKAAATLPDLQRLINASSTAVYGPRALHPQAVITTDSLLAPNSLYGYWKIFTEGVTQAFHMESGIPAINIRLATCYGPGRDKGFTSAPTTALKAAALGLPYAMPYHGNEHYHYVHDVAAGIAQSCLAPFDGLATILLRGQTVSVATFLQHIRDHAPGADISIADDAIDLPFICDLDNQNVLERFPDMPLTDLATGVGESLNTFRSQIENGQLAEI